MKFKLFLPSLLALLLFIQHSAEGRKFHKGESASFLKDGKVITGTIVDMSSRTGKFEYMDNLKIHRSRIWMINFISSEWDFPGERDQLSRNTDTIFLKNGDTLHVQIVDFSSRRHVFEFRNGGSIYVSKVKRIYLCCTRLPNAYKKKVPKPDEYASFTFLLNGRVIDSPLDYLNHRKTGFQDRLQINTKDIWMINFIDEYWDFPRERRQLDNQLDTVFLKNGGVDHDTVVDFNCERGTFRFENIGPLHYSKIKRIYFCCVQLPAAYRSKTGKRLIEKRH